VPRYFFSFLGEQTGYADLVGRELSDDEAAKMEARRLAAEVGSDGAIDCRLAAYSWIEVTDEVQRPVLRLPVAAAVAEPNHIS
jgi:hypothetical protein